MNTWQKSGLVIVGAVVFSTVAIQASDVLRGIDGNLLGLAPTSQSNSVCGAGAVQINIGTGALCVDQYESSAEPTCPKPVPATILDSQENLNDFDCQAQSVVEAVPWRFVSFTQAQQLCARAGKRLPTPDEWYQLALTQGDQSSCNTDSSGPIMTDSARCATAAGLHDVVGNVWEWVDGEVRDGYYNERVVPESGYVAVVDREGVVLETDTRPYEEYGEDYAVTKGDGAGTYAMIRGGFYDSGSDAGIFSQNLAVSHDLKTNGIGFRCVRSL